MIAAGLPMRVVTITSPGHFDTHATQAARSTSGLQLTSDSLLAFQRDLEARGIADRVLIHVWSEFGRRAAENASAGTDHGSAGIGFLIGTQVNGQQIGDFPGVTGGLDGNGNLDPDGRLPRRLLRDPRAVARRRRERRSCRTSAAYQRPSLLK